MVAVVTGAGHIGCNLVRALLETDRDVLIVDLREPTALCDLGAQWIRADVRDATAMASALRHAEVVFHLAAVISVAGSMGGLVESVNVDGVETTARAALAAGVPRFVHCSSVHAYDLMACRGTVVKEDSPRADDPNLPAYDRSKAAGERRLRTVIDDGLNAVILNPTGVIGPRDDGPSRMGAVLLAAARRRLPATIRGSFDWVDVRDVVRALLTAEHRGTTGENYLIGGHSACVADLARLAADAADVTPPVVDLSSGFAHIWSPLASWLARREPNPLLYTEDSLHALDSQPIVDHSKASAALDHRPRPLAETVADLIRQRLPTATTRD